MQSNQQGFLPFDPEAQQPCQNCNQIILHYKFQEINQYEDEEYQEKFEKKLQIAFIRKVYGILFVQCAITTLFCFISVNSAKFATFQKENLLLLILCIVLSLVLVIVLSCFPKVARKVPTNYILLFSFTFCEAYLTSYICSTYSGKVVLCAALLTTAAVIGLTLYACYTKTDFTMMGGMLFIILIVFVVFGFILMFIKIKILHLIYCVIGVLLFSVYLIYDTQLVVGKFSNQFSLDDYILAALNLYLDILNIFLFILQLLGDN